MDLRIFIKRKDINYDINRLVLGFSFDVCSLPVNENKTRGNTYNQDISL